MKNPWNETNEETVSVFVNRKNFEEIKFAKTDKEEQALFTNPDWMFLREIDVNMLTKEVVR